MKNLYMEFSTKNNKNMDKIHSNFFATAFCAAFLFLMSLGAFGQTIVINEVASVNDNEVKIVGTTTDIADGTLLYSYYGTTNDEYSFSMGNAAETNGGSFLIYVTALQPSTNYYFQVRDDASGARSNIYDFQTTGTGTGSTTYTVITATASSVSSSEATLFGSVTPYNGNIDKVGFIYSTDPSMLEMMVQQITIENTMSGNFVEGYVYDQSEGQFKAPLSDLMPDADYYFQACVRSQENGEQWIVANSYESFRTEGGTSTGGSASWVTIGSGTLTDQSLPTYAAYNYSITQQIYTASEIGQAGTIQKLAFFNNGAEETRTFDLYLLSTDRQDFSSTDDWEPVSYSDIAFSGSVTFWAGDWTEIELTTPFEYDGASNLIVVFDDNTGTYAPGMDFLVFDAASQAINTYSDGIDFDPTDLSATTASNVAVVKNQIKIGFDSSSQTSGSSVDWVTIGSGTDTSDQLPIVSTSNYSLTQQIYTYAEIARRGTIQKIAFYNTSSSGRTCPIHLYMVSTSRVSFYSITDMESVSPSDLVFSGNVTFLTNGWTEIELTTPFEYDGESNIMVVVDDDSGNIGNTMSFLVFDATSQALYAYSESNDFDATNLGTTGADVVDDVKNQIKLGFRSSSNSSSGHEYVDLGLPSGTKWATMNIGATEPSDFGNRYAWGETSPKDLNSYSWGNYIHCAGTNNDLTKYCFSSIWGYNGFTDELTTLEADDDAATVNWGEGWRMPTDEECQELYNNCSASWDTQNGVTGVILTSRINGNSIFIPIDPEENYGTHYWSSSFGTDDDDPTMGKTLYLNASNQIVSSGGDQRDYPNAIRPVYAPSNTAGNPTSSGLEDYAFTTGTDGTTYTPSLTQLIGSGQDDQASELTEIGFTFTYDEVEYTQFSVNSNGRLRLGNDVISTEYNNPFTQDNYTQNTPAIVGVGGDLSTGADGYVSTGLYGSSGSYIRVVEFMLATSSDATSSTYIKFQVQLFEATGEVRIVYSDYDNAPSGYQIGIGNADATKFWYVDPNSHTAAYATESTETTYDVHPGIGRYYSFAPPVQNNNSNPTDHDYVDLGLPSGILWATMNIGAEEPEDFGSYFAWGETSPKSTYNLESYTYANGYSEDDPQLTKYCNIDNRTILEDSDDAAIVNWGNGWRMPTYDEVVELRDYCRHEFTTQNGVPGTLVTGPNDRSIFIPAAGGRVWESSTDEGEGSYWANSLSTSSPIDAQGFHFEDNSTYAFTAHSARRYYGYPIRPVYAPSNTANNGNTNYNYDFEDATDTAEWTLANGTQTNQWYIGEAANNGGSNGLYISNDEGVSNSYTNNSESYVYAYRSININESATYYVDFDWMANGEGGWDVLMAFLIPSSVSSNLSAGENNGMSGNVNTTPDGWINCGDNETFSGNLDWQHSSTEISLERGTYNLVFFWKNDGSAGSNPPAAIDNISIVKVSCPQISGITASNITTESATISWTERGSAGSWEIIVSEDELDEDDLEAASPTATVSSTSYPATGLSIATAYYVYVRSVCSASEKSDWVGEHFNTLICNAEDMCEIQYSLSDSYGDGWNGNAINVIDVETGLVMATWTIDNGSSATGSLDVCDGREVKFEYVTGEFSNETSYQVFYSNGTEMFSGSDAMDSPQIFVLTCPLPVEAITQRATTTSTTATLAGELNFNKSAEVSQVGFEYGESEDQLTETETLTYSENTFSTEITGLTPQTTYYYRAFAIYNDSLTSYGAIVSFRTKVNDTDGTEDNPLTIDNAEEWSQFAEAMQLSENYAISTYKNFEVYNSGEDTYFELTADIDLADCNNVIVNKFTGYIIVDGKSITINNNEVVSYSCIFRTLENATIDGLNIMVSETIDVGDEEESYGPLCLVANSSTISNCTTSIASADVEISSGGGGNIGAFVGNSVNSTITNCTNNLPVNMSGGSDERAGGIVGYVNGGSVEQCTNNASIKGDYAGGIAGQIQGATLSTNLNAGNVTGSERAGGIVANAMNGDVIVDKCMNIAEVYSTNKSSYTVSTGGIVGYNERASLSISNCANYGSFPNLSAHIGGLFGNGIAQLSSNVSVPIFTGNSVQGNSFNSVYATIGPEEEGFSNEITEDDDFFDEQISDLKVDSLRLRYASRGTGKQTSAMVGTALQGALPGDWTFSNGLFPMPDGIPEDKRTTLARVPIYLAEGEKSCGVMSSFTVPTSISEHEVTWTSSNNSVISISDGTATVTRPALGSNNEDVTLTATYEGETKTFVLLVLSPQLVPVNTEDPYIDDVVVYLNGYFNYDVEGLSYLTEYGFIYSTNSNLSDSTRVVSSSISESNDFNYELDGLEEGVTYYVAAFATTADTTTYGETKDFRIPGPPSVVAYYPMWRTDNSATILFDITLNEEEDFNELENAFYYGTERNNLSLSSYIYYDEDNDNYSVDLHDLAANTKYYYVAEVTNDYGTGSSDTLEFITCGTMTDSRDNTQYYTIQIGNQTWMAQNLKYAGQEVSLGDMTTSETDPYYYYVNGEESNTDEYGYLYNWAAAMNGASGSDENPSGIQGICPEGWHLPSDAEWTQLTNYLGGTENAGAMIAGQEAAEGQYWQVGTLTRSTNFGKSGFNALPAGSYTGTNYSSFGTGSSFWSATENTSIYAYDRSFNYESTNVDRTYINKVNGISVRCVKVSTIYAYDTLKYCGEQYTFGTQTITASGDYEETFHLANDNDSIVYLNLTMYPTLTATVSEFSNGCFGANNGYVEVGATGGAGGYSYAWSTPEMQTSARLSNLTDGEYTVTVTDAARCTATVSQTIVTPGQLTVSIIGDDQMCQGDNAPLTANVEGGTPEYTYAWTGGTTTPSTTIHETGTYIVTVTDDASCTATGMITVTVNPAATLELTSGMQDQNLCYGESLTTIVYTYGGGANGASVSGLPAGMEWNTDANAHQILISGTPTTAGTYAYTITTTGVTSPCTNITITGTITVYMQLTATVSGNNPDCYGDQVMLTATPDGGSAPYNYNWSNNENSISITDSPLSTTTYTVTITDANGCTATASKNIVVGEPLNVSISGSTAIQCYGGTTDLSANASGGSMAMGYTYTWTGNVNGQNLTGVSAGDYSVVATDGNGCTATAGVAVTQPNAALTVSLSAGTIACSGGTTNINSTVNGGTEPYNYTWTPSGDEENLTGVGAGTYSLRVTDMNGCTATASATVNDGDSEVPLLTGTWPANILGQGNCLADADLNELYSTTQVKTLYEDDSEITVTASDATTGDNCSWTITRTYTIADACGNSTTNTMSVSGSDNTAPVITGTMPTKNVDGCNATLTTIYPAKTTVAELISEATALGGSLSISDNCSSEDELSLSSTESSTGTCPIVVTRTYTITDNCGSPATLSQTINVNVADFTLPADGSSTVACIDLATEPTPPTVNDNCGTVLSPSDAVEGGTYNGCSGTRTYTYTYTDCASNRHDWVYTYTIEPQDFDMPANGSSTVACASEITAPTLPVVTDYCGNTLTGVLKSGYPTETPSCEGSVVYMYTFTDCNGTAHDWTYTYTIEHTDAPSEVGGPVATTGTAECLADATAPTTLPVVKDVCGNTLTAPTPVVTDSPDPMTCEGTRTYTYIYKDCANLEFIWTYTYTIAHTTAPSEVGGPVATTGTAECLADATAPTTLPVVKDVCGNTLTAPTPVVTDSPDPITCEGTRTYTYTYKDCANKEFVWTYTYTIEHSDFDMPADGGTTVSCASAITAPTLPVVTDACGNVLTGVLKSGYPTDTPSCDGSVVYKYTFTDCAGNAHDWTYTYTIQRNVAPELTGTWPNNITGQNNCYENRDISELISDEDVAELYTANCGTISVTHSDVADPTSNCGWTVTRTYTITDGCNEVTKTQSVSGSDQTAPTLTGTWPSNIVGQNNCFADADVSGLMGDADVAALYSDGCGGTISVTHADANTSTDNCGWTITRTYTISDACGNEVTKTQSVSGSDQTAPTLTGTWPSNIVGQNNCFADADLSSLLSDDDVAELYSDGCGGTLTVSHTDANTSTDNCGWTITRTYTIRDACGNETTNTQSVSGSDQGAPTLTGTWPSNIVGQNNCFADADLSGLMSDDDVAALYNDGCGGTATVTHSDANTATDNCGWTITRTYTITNACGTNSTTNTQSVSGSDQTAPTLTGTWPSNITGQNNCFADADVSGLMGDADVAALYSDGCGGNISVTHTDANTTTDNCGWTITRTYTISDACGNEITNTQSVSGSDQTAPTIGDDNLNRQLTSTNCVFTVPDLTSEVRNIASDNCTANDNLTISQNITAGTEITTATTVIVTVTDQCGNNSTKEIELTLPEELTTSLSANPATIACNGGTTSITNTPNGGTAPYQYFWSNSTNEQNLADVSAGTYTVTVRDNNGCSVVESLEITQPNALTASLSATEISCHGETSTITNTVAGGTTSYTYAWESGETSQNLTGVSGGTYSVTVTDANGCIATATITVTEPDQLTSSLSAGEIGCNGETTDITNTVNGGTTPITYTWSNGANTQGLTGVGAGTYSVTVTDNNGCSVVQSATISQPEALTASLSAGAIDCHGETTNITSTVNGGTQNYSYAWSNGATTNNLTDVGAGTYSVTVSDANSCTASAITTVSAPDALLVSISGSTSVCENTTSTLTANVQGGTPDFTYLWNDGTTTVSITTTQLTTATEYSVTVNDANNCSATASVNVEIGDTPGITISDVTAICVGGNTILQANVSNAGSDYTVEWTSTDANAGLPADVTTDAITVTPTTAGTYTYTASLTATSCSDGQPFTSSANVTLTVNSLPDAAITNNTNETTITCNTTQISLTATGGNAYQWSNGVAVAENNVTSAGAYNVTVTDANGCSNTASITIDEDVTAPAVSINNNTGTTLLTCTTTSINVEATGDDATYLWSNGATTATNAITTGGTYTVTASADNGCTSTAAIEITPNADAPSVSITNNTGETELTCALTSISVTATGSGTSYEWSNGALTAENTLTASGTYIVTATAGNGCSASDQITITQNIAAPDIIATATESAICHGESTTISATGGESYTWSPETGLPSTVGSPLTATPTTTTTYTVTGVGTNGCEGTAEVVITVNLPTSSEFTATACDLYTWNGTNYTESGDFQQTFPNANGCDSVVTLHLTINNAVTNEFSETACTSYEWNSTTYTESGDYVQTLQTVNGCDSVVTLHLTINMPTESNDTVTVCGSYEWNGTTYTESGNYQFTLPNANANGCDSIANLYLTINQPLTEQVEITACDSYEWNGEIYTESGDYEQTFVAINGCDSVVTLHLTINSSTTGEFADLMCSGVPYIYEGQTFTQAGTYEVTLVNSAGCDSVVTLTLTYADNCNGTVYGVITDAVTGNVIPNAKVTLGNRVTWANINGEYSLSILRGRRAFRVSAVGYISHFETIDVQSDIELDIALNKPQIQMDVDSISVTSYPYFAQNDSITIRNTGNATLIWSSVTDYDNVELLPETEDVQHRSNSRSLWDSIQTFTTQFNAEQAIATDGFFIYTSSWQRPGEFNRYTPEGEYVETFVIENVGMIRNLSYDGTFFYGTEATNIVFKLDLDNQILVDSIATDIADIRHCSFNRLDGSLLAGSWNSLYRVDTATGASTQIRDDLTNIYSSAFDNLSPGGPYLWLFSQTSQNNGPSAYIRQFDLSNGDYTSKTHYLDDIGLSSSSLAGGICASEKINEGKFVLLADVQNPSGNNVIATYEIGRTNSVVTTDIKSGELQPNESMKIAIKEHATETGEFAATIKYRAAVMGRQSNDVIVNISAIAPECDAVQQITATTDYSTVTLEWQPVELGENESVSYLVYNTASQSPIDTLSEASASYSGLPSGEHCFYVRALTSAGYTCLSEASDTVCAEINDSPCDIPLFVEARSDGETITVSWNQPADVDNYSIYRDGESIAENLTTTNFVDRDVVPETEYCYTVVAQLGSGSCNEISGNACITIVSGVCSEAPVLTADAVSGSVALEWTESNGAVNYRLFRNDTFVGATSGTNYIDNVNESGEYCYRIESICEYGMYNSSDEVCISVDVTDGSGEGDAIEEWTVDNLTLYPNPTYGQFFIEGQRIAVVQIFNAAGMLVAEIENTEADRITINCESWNPGLYNIRIISTEGETATRKVTIFR